GLVGGDGEVGDGDGGHAYSIDSGGSELGAQSAGGSMARGVQRRYLPARSTGAGSGSAYEL
ncbi:MAG: hypothetical protein OXF01_14390, partial [Gemmatimonadetes bacterium]|nr:hypothetical protein [Gemmatimonadota bacterium]